VTTVARIKQLIQSTVLSVCVCVCVHEQGKSMSLICGALTWLMRNTDEHGLPLKSAVAATADAIKADAASEAEQTAEEPSWLSSFSERKADREASERQATVKTALRQIENIKETPELQSKKRKMGFAYNHHERKRPRSSTAFQTTPSARPKEGAGDEDEQHIVDAYDSGADAKAGFASDSGEDSPRPGGAVGRWPGRTDEKPHFGITKIIYCSRTHSQISQFVREIQKTAFADRIRVVSLGSRKNLCINESVSSLRSDLRMADKCLDMLQGSKTKKDKKQKKAKCPFYEKELLGHYKDYALVSCFCRTCLLG
jgi:chromosome transmission fidelity protein 1